MTSPPGPKARGFGTPENIDDLFLAKLTSSGLDLTDAKQLGYLALDREETFRLKLPIWSPYRIPSFSLPYFDPLEKASWNFTRYRYLLLPVPEPKKTKDGKDFPKYIQPKNSPLRAYFPTIGKLSWKKVFEDIDQPIIITEGELKAACATKRGFPTIGLGGVDSWKQGKLNIDFLPDLEAVPWDGRTVYICYDSDAENSEGMLLARQRLANELLQRGSTVFATHLPQLGQGKTGLDDFLIDPAGGVAAFKQVLTDATQLRISWKLFYQFRGNSPAPSVANVLVALRNAPELQEVFCFDEMLNLVVVSQRLPQDPSNLPLPRRQTDDDVTRVQEWLQREGGLITISADMVLAGIRARAVEQPFHPIRDYLNGLVWDKTSRLNSWLNITFGVTVNPYSTMIGAMFLISMIARVEPAPDGFTPDGEPLPGGPGCQADHAMVLEGEQGEGKSSACRILADQWFSDNLPDVNGDQKRLSMHLRGKWLIEIAELGAMKKSDVEDVKKFISRREEVYTPMYGRAEVDEKRQCIFIGTTNEDVYLKDDTGNRRFWPVRITKVDLDWLRRNRDQLLAEATVRYRAGEEWWPNKAFIEEHIKPEQDARFSGGEWDDEVDKFAYLRLKSTEPPLTCRVYPKEIAVSQLMIEPVRFTAAIARTISQALKRLGWEIQPKSNGRQAFAPGPKLLARLALEKAAEPPSKLPGKRTKTKPEPEKTVLPFTTTKVSKY